jgi:hypothetical protein
MGCKAIGNNVSFFSGEIAMIPLHGSSRVSQNIKGCLKTIYFQTLGCSQIWLNFPVVDRHFSYICGGCDVSFACGSLQGARKACCCCQ